VVLVRLVGRFPNLGQRLCVRLFDRLLARWAPFFGGSFRCAVRALGTVAFPFVAGGRACLFGAGALLRSRVGLGGEWGARFGFPRVRACPPSGPSSVSRERILQTEMRVVKH
jgi:hypothetical protein